MFKGPYKGSLGFEIIGRMDGAKQLGDKSWKMWNHESFREKSDRVPIQVQQFLENALGIPIV